MITVLSLRDVRIAGGGGHVIWVKANTNTQIPDELFPAAAQAGCILVGDAPPPVIKTGRQALIDVVTELLETGEPEDFKIDGTPKLNVVKKMMGGMDISQADLYDVYTKLTFERKTKPENEDTE